MKRLLFAGALALSALALIAPTSAKADTVDIQVRDAQPVVVAQYGPRVDRHQLVGVVGRFGGFDMTLRVEGSPLPVRLHQGTIINPTGLTIKPGMRVRVFGHWANGAFQADRIVLVY